MPIEEMPSSILLSETTTFLMSHLPQHLVQLKYIERAMSDLALFRSANHWLSDERLRDERKGKLKK
jgi:hypothetical protein